MLATHWGSLLAHQMCLQLGFHLALSLVAAMATHLGSLLKAPSVSSSGAQPGPQSDLHSLITHSVITSATRWAAHLGWMSVLRDDWLSGPHSVPALVIHPGPHLVTKPALSPEVRWAMLSCLVVSSDLVLATVTDVLLGYSKVGS